MSSRDYLFRLNDILESIERIQEYIINLDQNKFKSDKRTIDAVIRNLEIIGEAARHIPDKFTMDYPEIPWRYMRDMRNALIHEYFGINSDIIWETIIHDLPPLKQQLENIKDI